MGCVDLGGLTGSCDFCGTSYRYEHSIEHFDAGLTADVGCVCAEKLCDEYSVPKAREKELKKIEREKKAAAKKEQSAQENYLRSFYITKNGNYHFKGVTVFRVEHGWKSVFEGDFSPAFKNRIDAALYQYQKVFRK